MTTPVDVDVVIVGGGIGGSALAAGLAQAGLAVELLERETEFVDRVRGEWMAPWGVAETRKLGIYDELMAAGGNHVARGINYDELLSPQEAEANTLPLEAMHPDAPGPMCMQHVVMQNTLLRTASNAGATVRRGVSKVEVEAGAAPAVRFTHENTRFTRRCRLVVGADGRSSIVRRTLGFKLEEEPVDHLISGLLVEGADAWPSDVQSIGKAGEVMYLIFPQGDGKVRLYVDYDLADRGRYTGPKGAANLLRAFDVDYLPGGRAIAEATPIGPCHAYPSQDAVVVDPFTDGAVLIGDAGGYTDPIFGQGLSNTLRDVRLVRDLLLENPDWSTGMFRPYGDERNERFRREMHITRFATALYARFDADSVAARARAMERMAAKPELQALFMATFAGPETQPAEVFTDDYFASLFGP